MFRSIEGREERRRHEKMKLKEAAAFLIGAAVSGICNAGVPIFVMVGCNIVDYITGLMAIPYRDGKKLSSAESIAGIFRKISMWMLVALGLFLDMLIAHYGISTGIPYTVACITATWISVNEAISILENVADMGIVVPSPLKKIVELMEKEVDKKK